MSEITNVSAENQLVTYFEEINIGVITALQSELNAIIRLADSYETIVSSRTYYKLKFTTQCKSFQIIGHTLDQMGIASMAIASMDLINSFPLKYLALIGIAAGSDSKSQNLGDIVVPTAVYNYESGKYHEVKSKIPFFPAKLTFSCDYKSYQIDTEIIQKIRACNNQEFLDEIQNGWHTKQKQKLSIHFGDFACGSAVIASAKKTKEIEKQISRKYQGLDMESYALAAISHIKTKKEPKLFVLKSITDFADKSKGDNAHEYASYTSACFFKKVCELVLS
ncbi:MAG: hypothetical protein V4561_07210 [Bacteroidota bacterium]